MRKGTAAAAMQQSALHEGLYIGSELDKKTPVLQQQTNSNGYSHVVKHSL
jgi:hypothetical protein